MSHRIECHVGCLKCNVVVGKVIACDDVKAGFWRNTPVPDPMPKYCKLCQGVLSRLEP